MSIFNSKAFDNFFNKSNFEIGTDEILYMPDIEIWFFIIDFIIFPILTVVTPEYKTLLYPSIDFPFLLNNHSNNSVKLYTSLPIIEHLKVSDELFFTSPLALESPYKSEASGIESSL